MSVAAVTVTVAEWRTVEFGDVCQKVETVNPTKRPDDEFTYIDVSSVSNQTFSIKTTSQILGRDAPSRARRLIRTGDVIFATVRPTLMRVAHVPAALNGAVCSTGYIVLRPKAELDARFLFYSLLRPSFLSAMENLQSGASYPAVNDGQVLAQTISLPSLHEQKRIVAVLDQALAALDRARAHAQANLADAAELFDASLRVMFRSIAEARPSHTLNELTEAIVDCEHKTAPITDAGYPSIRTPNVGKGVLNLEGVNRVSEAAYKAWTRRAVPEPGDLIMAREAPAGNVAVIPDGEKVCLGQRTLLIKPNKETTDPAYLASLLLHPTMQGRLLDKSSGATVLHVNMRDIRALPIPDLPTLSEQMACAQKLGQIRAMTSRVVQTAQAKLSQLAMLRQSLLQKAYAGELSRW